MGLHADLQVLTEEQYKHLVKEERVRRVAGLSVRFREIVDDQYRDLLGGDEGVVKADGTTAFEPRTPICKDE